MDLIAIPDFAAGKMLWTVLCDLHLQGSKWILDVLLPILFNNIVSFGFLFRGYGKLGTGDLQVIRSAPAILVKK